LFRRATLLRETQEEEEEEEEEGGLFKAADAVNEETPSANALPRCRRLVLPRYTPEGDSPLSGRMAHGVEKNLVRG